MLQKAQRLTRLAFDTFFKTGKRFHSPTLTVVYTPHKAFHGSVVVGKKVAKLAVRRNTIRRRIYDQLRTVVHDTGATGVYIVLVKPTFNSLTRTAARAEVQSLLYKIIKGT